MAHLLDWDDCHGSDKVQCISMTFHKRWVNDAWEPALLASNSLLPHGIYFDLRSPSFTPFSFLLPHEHCSKPHTHNKVYYLKFFLSYFFSKFKIIATSNNTSLSKKNGIIAWLEWTCMMTNRISPCSLTTEKSCSISPKQYQ